MIVMRNRLLVSNELDHDQPHHIDYKKFAEFAQNSVYFKGWRFHEIQLWAREMKDRLLKDRKELGLFEAV